MTNLVAAGVAGGCSRHTLAAFPGHRDKNVIKAQRRWYDYIEIHTNKKPGETLIWCGFIRYFQALVKLPKMGMAFKRSTVRSRSAPLLILKTCLYHPFHRSVVLMHSLLFICILSGIFPICKE